MQLLVHDEHEVKLLSNSRVAMSYFANGKVKNEEIKVMKLSNASLGQAYSD